ncbi:putative 3-dehydroshikimate dehydratase [Sclerotinia borealis F-4128]|uniref:Putative 3-dehydroshikimate dehydratase n=1 Tax=Sclerotinia borealis (strain F-4128) TaxID=1432307 RepID=W9CP51_SCLBF|nr:putative 3-dehydroshikimate dehydratase [Sclerotinia borealis F-4128]
MTISSSSLLQIPASFASVSLGTPSTPLSSKLSAISSSGFTSIELGFPDLLSFTRTYHNNQAIPSTDYDSLCIAGIEVHKLCLQHNLGIMMLQPFSNFEGWPEGSEERKDAFERARGWIRIMGAVGTDMLQVGSSDSEGISSDFNVLAKDLGELADMLAVHGYRLAYENWCWATHAPTWKSVWEIVQLANRPNMGLCLDTFQTSGSEYADPSTPSGLISHLGSQAKLHMNFTQSLQSLTSSIPPEKIYPITRSQWSHDYRPYPFNNGYLPVTEVARAVLGTGFRGWFSMEVFDGGADGKWRDVLREKEELEGFCRGAMEAHMRLLAECAGLGGRGSVGRRVLG